MTFAECMKYKALTTFINVVMAARERGREAESVTFSQSIRSCDGHDPSGLTPRLVPTHLVNKVLCVFVREFLLGLEDLEEVCVHQLVDYVEVS